MRRPGSVPTPAPLDGVYLNAAGLFMPGAPVANEDIDRFIAPLNHKSERIKRRVLRDNGIRTRHYAIDEQGNTRYWLLRELAAVWHGYRSRAWRTTLVRRIVTGTLSHQDYLRWMACWIPQVREGSAWMREAAANLGPRYAALKPLIEAHAGDEQFDFRILFNDYRAAGGTVPRIDELRRNAGGEALNAYMHARAREPDPIGLLGAIYVIEGTGQRIIPHLLPRLRRCLALEPKAFRFLHYHGENDMAHLERWLKAVQLVKTVIPDAFTSSSVLHRFLAWGLRNWVTATGNWLIVRHFHLGAEILDFIRRNAPVNGIPEGHDMRLRDLDQISDHAFLRHDLNLFNFVIHLSQRLKHAGAELGPPPRVDFSGITDGPLDIAPMPDGWSNVIDLQTAIELFTPVYQLFLTDNDFWRATNSLQLDETIAIYVSRILGEPFPVMLVNNRHPMVPESTLRAGPRLVLHGLNTEMLHAMLVDLKRKQAAESSG